MNAVLHLDAECLPNSLIWQTPLSDEELEALCLANNSVQLERTKEGAIIVNAAAGAFTSDGNAEIIRQLRNWWITHRRGRVFDSNGGCFLADGSMMVPDAAYVLPERLRGLGKRELTGLLRFCPDFVIELLSASDRLPEAQAKMNAWVANGATIAWLIDPYRQKVFVYQGSHRPPTEVIANQIHGSGPVEGFTLDLSEVWRCYEV